jgi:hypothetical protein
VSNDIERLLAAAADDADQPLQTDVEDILIRARRSVRRTRIATITTAALTTGAIIVAGIVAWPSNQADSGPAGEPGTISTELGSGKKLALKPPVSPLSDVEILKRCDPLDKEYIESMAERTANSFDKAGRINAKWTVVVKTGTGDKVSAMLLSPDKTIVGTCRLEGESMYVADSSYGRTPLTEVPVRKGLMSAKEAFQGPATMTRVFADLPDGSLQEGLVGKDGFYSFGAPDRSTQTQVRGYDADGKKVFEWSNKPPTPTAEPTVDPSITVKTAEPIEPVVVLTTDPATGKRLAPAPPVSPLTDDQIRDRCRLWEDEIATNPAYGGQGKQEQDQREKDAGPITSSWSVALKTGTGDKLTAVLVSPDQRVAVWCHMTKPTPKGGESDYTRRAVNADGKFADNFEFAMVPEGVAQIVVDLPKTGPTRALISNGYYIWGLTGGNSDIKEVRVRGYDAQGKQVYDEKKQVDAD